jgi:sugar lactone lactonase YvrE
LPPDHSSVIPASDPRWPQVRLLVNRRCATGENPYWCDEERAVYWTDIPRGRIYRYAVQTGLCDTVYAGEPVGGFTRQRDGRWLLFRVADIALLDADGVTTRVRPFLEEGMRRFNDVIADPRGRVFAGTIGSSPTSGGLYRVDVDGVITRLFTGTGVANGMGFSPQADRFYWTCSTSRRIDQFDYDLHTGAITGRRVFNAAVPAMGRPDGLTVDREGGVWTAWNGGQAIRRHDESGPVVRHIPMPVPKVTSLTFGGPDFDRLYVTTGGGDGTSPDAGALFEVTAGVRGRAEFRSAIDAGRGKRW